MSYDPNSLVNAMREAKVLVGDATPQEFLEATREGGSVKTVLDDMIRLIDLSTSTGDLVMIATVDVRIAATFAETAKIMSMLAFIFGKRRISNTIRQLYLAIIRAQFTSDKSAVMMTVRYSEKRAIVVCLRELSQYIDRAKK